MVWRFTMFLTNPLPYQRMRGGYRRLSLAFVLTLSLSPSAEEFNYSATVVCDVKEAGNSAMPSSLLALFTCSAYFGIT